MKTINRNETITLNSEMVDYLVSYRRKDVDPIIDRLLYTTNYVGSPYFKFCALYKRKTENDIITKELFNSVDWFNEEEYFEFDVRLHTLLSDKQNDVKDIKILSNLNFLFRQFVANKEPFEKADSKLIEKYLKQIEILKQYYVEVNDRINKGIFAYRFEGKSPYEITADMINNENNPIVKKRMMKTFVDKESCKNYSIVKAA